MTIKKFKNIISGFLITVFIAYSAPAGICVSAITPTQLRTQVQQPALRGSVKDTELKIEAETSITKVNQKVTLSLRDSDVKQVLRMFADKAGLNIIFHESVKGNVTLDLVDVPLNDAFKIVLQSSDLTYLVDKKTIFITSSYASPFIKNSTLNMMIIPVKYVDAATLADFLNQNIFSLNKPGISNAQVAVTNPGRNEILIFGSRDDYLMAKKVINQFDVKPLEETFVVNHTTPKEMAELLCKLLFKDAGTYDDTTEAKGEMKNAVKGTTTDNATKADKAPSTGLILGDGVVACQYNNMVQTNSIASLKTSNVSVTYFPKRGTLSVLGGSAEQMQLVKEFISKNDKKQPQAYLEVAIVELNEKGTKEFNNTWQVYSGLFSGGFDGSTSTNSDYPTFFRGDSYDVSPGTTTTAYEIKDGIITTTTTTTPATKILKYAGAPTIAYSLNYVLQNGKGRILANPKILITNGQTSSIDLSSDYIKTVNSQIVTNSTSLVPTIQRTYVVGDDEGIKIEIVPFISPEGYVSLNIKPEYATEKEKVYAQAITGAGTDLVATLLQRRNLDLKNIRIKDGETLVIGGMIRESEIKNISKIPVLGDIPGLGMFFRNTSSVKEKQELVIMITPKIIKEDEDLVSKEKMTL